MQWGLEPFYTGTRALAYMGLPATATAMQNKEIEGGVLLEMLLHLN